MGEALWFSTPGSLLSAILSLSNTLSLVHHHYFHFCCPHASIDAKASTPILHSPSTSSLLFQSCLDVVEMISVHRRPSCSRVRLTFKVLLGKGWEARGTTWSFFKLRKKGYNDVCGFLARCSSSSAITWNSRILLILPKYYWWHMLLSEFQFMDLCCIVQCKTMICVVTIVWWVVLYVSL